jgi:anti-sigma B factor antagonist
MSDMFSVSSERLDDDFGVVVLSGEVDIFTAPQFKESLLELLDGGVRRLVVDLSDVTFIDSTALGVLIGGVRRVHGAGGAMTIVVTTRPVERVLSITGLDRVFSLHATREEAVAALA